MAKRITFLFVVLLGTTSSAVRAGPTLPVVADVAPEDLRGQCRRVMQTLEELKAPLPLDASNELRALLKEASKDPQAAAEKMQKLLDARCLIGVTINPESRVKAARGPAEAILEAGRTVTVLVKVQNDAGVTHPLKVAGPQVRGHDQEEGAWLEAEVYTKAPFQKKLSGKRLEYLLLRLTAHASGKREATLKFDVGQGTQDLGFRAEVPVLFTIKRPSLSEKGTGLLIRPNEQGRMAPAKESCPLFGQTLNDRKSNPARPR
ncbi:MAG TPA: hypothetical protein VKI17_13060 [Gemmataceae bacterium]|nr:hypothetical protein [Gemmataceae bacterium]